MSGKSVKNAVSQWGGSACRSRSAGRTRQTNSGFTLVELLVVVGIISLLATILLPTLSRAIQMAKGVVCQMNLHAIGRTTLLYTEENHGFLPDMFYTFEAGESGTIILLFVPKKAVATGWDAYSDCQLICPSDDEPSTMLVRTSSDGPAWSGIEEKTFSYAFNVDLMMQDVSLHSPSVSSCSILFFWDGFLPIERYGKDDWKQGAYKGPAAFTDDWLDKRHFDCANGLFLDGHVERISEVTDEMIYINGPPPEE